MLSRMKSSWAWKLGLLGRGGVLARQGHVEERLGLVLELLGPLGAQLCLLHRHRHLGGLRSHLLLVRIRLGEEVVDALEARSVEQAALDLPLVNVGIALEFHQHLGAAQFLHVRDHGGVGHRLHAAPEAVILGRDLFPVVAVLVAGLVFDVALVEAIELVELGLFGAEYPLDDRGVELHALFDQGQDGGGRRVGDRGVA